MQKMWNQLTFFCFGGDFRMQKPELIVMLTHNDRTVENAARIFEECKNSRARFWGFKEKGIPLAQMKDLFSYMKECGKTTVLEVVEYTEKECMEGAGMAVECGCDILMGTSFSQSVLELCNKNRLKYMPFVGKVTGRPSVLEGTVEEMIEEARRYLGRGVYGLDLLGYRYTKEAASLIHRFVSQIDAPVCIAGSINSCQRLMEVKTAAPWAFTIGGAFFENKFSGTFRQQIDKVYEFMAREGTENA